MALSPRAVTLRPNVDTKPRLKAEWPRNSRERTVSNSRLKKGASDKKRMRAPATSGSEPSRGLPEGRRPGIR
jgi:hypothetical protein